METAVVWALALAAIIISVGAAIYWGTGDKLIGLWTMVAGAILVVLGAGFQWHHIVGHEKASAVSVGADQARAYVIVDASEIRNFGTGLALEGWVMLKNTGNTPALNIERGSKLMMTPFPAASFPILEWGGAKSDLGPRGEVMLGPVPLPRALTPQENAAIVAGRSALYLFGEIRYQDIFKQNRTTKFRVLYRGNGIAPAVGSVLPTIHDAEGNKAD